MKQILQSSLKLLVTCTACLSALVACAEIPAASDQSSPQPLETFSFAHRLDETARAPIAVPALDSSELHLNRLNVKTMDLTVQEADIWARIRCGFGMPDLTSPAVDKQLEAFAAHPQAVTNILERGRKYLYHIVVELEKRGMPSELALLPLVESAYNPLAFSSAKAAGLWQFVPSTGRDFQLQQNWWVDERRDVLASTSAALQYLQAVYELQGDWHLALASYNWGENAVLRAVNTNRNAGKPTDFNSLTMPKETQQYVPKLQAIKMIVAHPERYGIKLPSIPNEPYFVSVERTQGMDVAVAAKLAEMPLAEFRALNPAYNRPVIPGNHDADLLLPVENARKFRENLAAHAGQPLVNWKTFTVPRTIRIEEVARGLKLDLDVLRNANGLPAHARLASGYTLLVPQATDTDVTLQAPARTTASRKPSHTETRTATKNRPVAQTSKPHRRS